MPGHKDGLARGRLQRQAHVPMVRVADHPQACVAAGALGSHSSFDLLAARDRFGDIPIAGIMFRGRPAPPRRRGSGPTLHMHLFWSARMNGSPPSGEIRAAAIRARRLKSASRYLGASTGSDEPATEAGVDLSAGDDADATADGGPRPAKADEPDLKDAAAGPRQADLESAE
jgi:hypothetical protein